VWSGRAHFKETLDVDLNSSDALTVVKMSHRAFITTIISCYIRVSFCFDFLIMGHCQEPYSGMKDGQGHFATRIFARNALMIAAVCGLAGCRNETSHLQCLDGRVEPLNSVSLALPCSKYSEPSPLEEQSLVNNAN